MLANEKIILFLDVDIESQYRCSRINVLVSYSGMLCRNSFQLPVSTWAWKGYINGDDVHDYK